MACCVYKSVCKALLTRVDWFLNEIEVWFYFLFDTNLVFATSI